MKSGIYTIQNILNKKIYVGQSINVEDRLQNHKTCLINNYHINRHLQDSVNKYGIDNFEFLVLLFCDERFLSSEEHYWTNLLNSNNYKYGYNIAIINPNGNHRLAESTKKLISNIRKEQYKDVTKNPFYGKKHSDETKLKMSIKGKGLKKPKWTPETRVKNLEARKKAFLIKKLQYAV